MAVTSPTQLTGLQLWLDANDFSASADFTRLTAWNDKSGNARHATQTNGEAYHPYVSLNQLGGKPMIMFDGFETNFNTLDGTSVFAGHPFTVFIVDKVPNFRVDHGLIFAGNDFVDDQVIFIGWNAVDQYGANAWGPDPGITANMVVPPISNITTVTRSTAIGKVYQNGTLRYSDAANHPNLVSFSNACIGGGNGNQVLNGYIGEIIVYNRILTDTERQDVETYLNGKWMAGPVSPTVVREVFSGSYQLIADRPPVQGPSWSLFEGITNWEIAEQGYAWSNATGRSSAVLDAGISDGLIKSKIEVLSTTHAGYIVFRAVNTSDYWLLWARSGFAPRVYRIQGGVFTQFNLSGTGNAANGDTYMVELNGSTIKAYRNGTLGLTMTDTFNQTATKAGVGHEGDPSIFFDYLTVETLTAAAEGTTGSISYATKQIINRTASTAYATKQAINQTASAAFATKQIISAVGSSAVATKQIISQVGAVLAATRQSIYQVGAIAYATQQTITDGGIPGSVAYSTKQIINLTASLLAPTRQTIYQAGSSEWATKQSIIDFVEIVKTVNLLGEWLNAVSLQGECINTVSLQGEFITSIPLLGEMINTVALEGEI